MPLNGLKKAAEIVNSLHENPVSSISSNSMYISATHHAKSYSEELVVNQT